MNATLKKFLKMQFFVVVGVVLLGMVTVAALGAVTGSTGVTAEDNTTADASSGDINKGLLGVGAGLAIGLAGLGASIGMGSAGAAAIGAMTEKPEVFGRALIFVVLIEAVAIYGLVIAFLLYLSL